MDILEQGPERPVSPARRRAATVVAVAVALGIVVARYHPSSSAPVPPPVAISATPQPPTPQPPTPSPSPSFAPAPVPGQLARVAMPCDWWLGQLALPKLDKWQAKVVSTTRVANTQTRTYRRAGGEIRVAAGCGPIKWVLPLGMADDTNVYVDTPQDGQTAATEIWRADGVTGWYRIQSDGPHGSVLTPAELSKLKLAIDRGAPSV
ncbi:MAG: hypothetical protein QOH99_1706 [Frankiaceae bacterium]|nr:hypothetical protein [Frankiaceae bacterium]